MGTFLSCLALPWLSSSLAALPWELAALPWEPSSPALPCHGSLLPLLALPCLPSLTALALYSLPPTNAVETKPPNRETKRRSEATEARNRTGRPTGNPAPANSVRSPPKLPDRHLLSSRSPDSLIKPFLPAVPRKQSISLSRSPKGPEGHYHPFFPKKRGGEGARPPTLPLKPFSWFPGWDGAPEAVFSGSSHLRGATSPGGEAGGTPSPPSSLRSTL